MEVSIQIKTYKKKLSYIVNNSHIVKYIVIGVLTQVIDLVTFALLVNVGVWFIVADFINNPLVLGFNYLGHKYITFDEKKWTKAEVGRYLGNLLIMYVYTTALLIIMINFFHWDQAFSKGVTIILTPLANFLILKRFVFKK